LRLIFGTPKARAISACLALPLTQNCAVIIRNEAMSSSSWLNTGMLPLK
jgi:hypothetical protein